MDGDSLAALNGRRIGPHLPLRGNMVKAAGRAQEIGATALQIFSDNPTAWRRRSNPPDDLVGFHERLRAADIGPLAIHAPYLINLAAPDEVWERSVTTLAGELAMAARYGAAFLNVHIGSHRGSGDDAGLRRIGAGVARVLAEVPSRALPEARGHSTMGPEARTRSGAPGPHGSDAARPEAQARGGAMPGGQSTGEGDGVTAVDEHVPLLVLENSAGGGDGMGSTVEELARILQAIDSAGGDVRRVGFCLDTAHAWAAGYEISQPEETDRLLEMLDAQVGPERVVMLHLNDSKAGLNSHLDRHEHIGAGMIGPRGMEHLLRHPRLAAVPYYLETPGMDEGYDAVNMDRVRRLIGGLPLEPLPAEPSREQRGRRQGRRGSD